MRRSPRSTSLGGFADRSPGSLVVAHAEQVGGVVEHAVSQMVGGGVLAQPGDRGGERRTGVRAAVGGDEAGAGQVAFGALHRGQLPGPVPVEQGQQFGSGGGVGDVVGGAGG